MDLGDRRRLHGSLLVAAPTLTGDAFVRTVVLLLEHGPEGALGVVLNRPGDIALDEVVEDLAPLAAEPRVLHHGGPVEPTSAIVVGVMRPTSETGLPDRGPGWRPVVPPLVTVDMDHDTDELAAAMVGVRVFSGYAGWSAGQLEGEIAGGAWYVVPSLPVDVLDPAPDRLWAHVLRRQPWPLSAVAVCPLDPTMN